MDEEKRKKYEEILPNLNKRPRTVLEYILRNGSVSTYELGELGYDQPPRAAQDLKEAGIKLKTSVGKHPDTGRRMAIYSLDETEEIHVKNGRTNFPKKFKEELYKSFGYRCNICNTIYPTTLLQCDHRISVIVGGEVEKLELEKFQPLCAPHQRAKSWECENCPNRTEGNPEVCESCFWAIPDGEYTHIATRNERVVSLRFKDDHEVRLLRRLLAYAKEHNCTIEDEIKSQLSTVNNAEEKG